MSSPNRPTDRPENRVNRVEYLDAKLTIATDLFRDGKINRGELFRCEVDRSLLEDSGPIRMSRPN